MVVVVKAFLVLGGCLWLLVDLSFSAYEASVSVRLIHRVGFTAMFADAGNPYASPTGYVARARKSLTLCNLLQSMYREQTDKERSDRVEAALSKVSTAGPDAVHEKVSVVANRFILKA